jgi:Rps23 Pro-64 3,4-dihydroxylase Tpa1-like proline 4-hydroxylase
MTKSIQYHVINDVPIVIMDDYYDNTSCQKIWQELCWLNNDSKLPGPKDSGSAFKIIDGEKVFLKKNKAVILDEVFQKREFSNILKENRKIFNELELIAALKSVGSIYRYIELSNRDSTLVSYYENEDYYDFHYDRAVLTLITWFYQEPKKFTGGGLIFADNTCIECKYNRTIIFPSFLDHKVETIKISEEDIGKNLGRFSITQFITFSIE